MTHRILTEPEAAALTAQLHQQGIDVVFETVTLIHPVRPLATEEEVLVLRATGRLTDTFRYAPTGPARRPSCPSGCDVCAPATFGGFQ